MPTEDKPRKSLWGYGIAAVYTTFALATLSFVAFTMTQKVELVATDYYAQEVAYEKQIQRVRETRDLANAVTCALTADGQFIRLQMPPEMAAAQGTVLLYRPSESALDQELKLNLDDDGSQTISTAKLTKGAWRVKVTWAHAGREFYSEFLLQV
jgi:nitrogen fixation protein FixH